jgi:hypothetical protein
MYCHTAMGIMFCGAINSTRYDEIHERIATLQEKGIPCPKYWTKNMRKKYGEKKKWESLKQEFENAHRKAWDITEPEIS